MFCYAKISSFYIAKGNGEFIVDLQQSKLNKISGDNTLAYVGLAGEYFILYGIQTRRVFIDLPPLFVPSFKLELGSMVLPPFLDHFE
jgi:hypothetical protein